MAARSHWPDHRRDMREGWLGMVSRVWNLRPSSHIGPGVRWFIAIARSSDPADRAPVELGYMGLRPVPAAIRTSTYLGVCGPSSHRPVFSMPTEIPQAA